MRAPRRVRSVPELRAFQRLMMTALMRPLVGRDDGIDPRWSGSRSTSEIAAGFIKPNDRLSSVERLEIYARGYWYRVIDSIHEDCPGLRAAIGEKRFFALARAYLEKYPSRSFTLRDACDRLARFIEEEPRWTRPHTSLAIDFARFEWAQTVAFDAARLETISQREIAAAEPGKLKLRLQPHLTVLELGWPIDTWVRAVKKREDSQGIASNSIWRRSPDSVARWIRRPRRRRTRVVVHRFENRIYHKRVPEAAFAILVALDRGESVAAAVSSASDRVAPDDIRRWFTEWTRLGWLCLRKPDRPETR